MAYHQDNQYLIHNKKRYSAVKYVALFLVSVVIVLVLRKVFRNFSYTLAVPVINSSIAFERGIYSITDSKSKMLRRIESLESENAELRTKMVDYSLLEKENASFKNSVISRSETVIASVIGKPSISAYDTLLLNIPDGIEQGKSVYTISGVPMGSITNVSGNIATVTLYSSPGLEIESDIVLADAMDTVSVTMRGRGGASFEAIVPKDVDVPVGSLANIPSLFNEPFAEVVKTVSRDDTKDQVVYLRSVVNFQYLRFLVIEQ